MLQRSMSHVVRTSQCPQTKDWSFDICRWEGPKSKAGQSHHLDNTLVLTHLELSKSRPRVGPKRDQSPHGLIQTWSQVGPSQELREDLTSPDKCPLDSIWTCLIQADSGGNSTGHDSPASEP